MQRFIATGLLAACASAVKINQPGNSAEVTAADLPAAGPPAAEAPAAVAPAAVAATDAAVVPAAGAPVAPAAGAPASYDGDFDKTVDHIQSIINGAAGAGADGHISFDEFKAVVPSITADEWAFIDAAGDGADATEVRKIAEMMAMNPVAQEAVDFFVDNDTNGDWSLQRDEIKG